MKKNIAEEFLIEEYIALSNNFNQSEEIGNTRLNYFLTLTSAIIGGTGIAGIITRENNLVIQNNSFFVGLLFVGLLALFVYGLVTFNRIIQRNKTTDEIKIGISKIRKYFAEKYSPILKYLPYSPYSETLEMKILDDRIKRWKYPFTLGSGGLIQTIAMLNSFIFTAIIPIFLTTLLELFPKCSLCTDLLNSTNFIILIIILVIIVWLIHWYYAYHNFLLQKKIHYIGKEK